MARVFEKHQDAMDGTTTETFRRIDLDPPLAPVAFEFTSPPGTPRKASLFEEAFVAPGGAGGGPGR